MDEVVFARGIDAHELAVRLGASGGPAAGPMTAAEIGDLDVEAYRSGEPGDGVVRVGEHAGWTFAIEYGDCGTVRRFEELSREGVEVVYYSRNPDHPPTLVLYARDGRHICGFGLGEERIRWGEEPDLLVPELVAAGILTADGTAYRMDGGDDYTDRARRALAVFEKRFRLSLPPAALSQDRLPVYAVRGAPVGDFDAVRAWAEANGHPLPDERLGLIPAGLRRSYVLATDPRRRVRLGYERAVGPAVVKSRTSVVTRNTSE
ncbi:hypothetical protein B1H18_00220 [Streptomyces tsukubensis]|uniref:Uncharacterized protein n=2 Tax=Streptomyces tsukubensis TaxID=83656 RepID=A0A1V4AGT1_9ACTN|nr:hypothetical protein B1H18_00220 [Streptomyces tsukubensis]